MKDCRNESRFLASLAVFRELYDSKKDVFGIIAEFLREIIIAKAKHQFNLTEITQSLNAYYDFNLPEAVVKISLSQLDFLKKSNGFYTVNNLAGVRITDINEKQTEILKSNSFLINKLLSFIEEEGKEELNDKEKEKVVDSFCSFLLDDLNSRDYFKYISAFVIKNRTDSGFAKQLSIIKEGVILYSGIRYSSNIIDVGSWDTCLTIFIDTEVLFNFAGYDGALYKTLFIDFLSFVNEINQKSSKKLIRLLYFNAVTDEIDRFYAKAEQIITGKEKLNPSRTAMASILDGCQTASDVVAKKTVFFELLKKNDILEDDYQGYYLPENHKYNISDQATIDKITNSLGRGDITEHLKFLNYT